jgi:hypothetical protein
MNNIQKALEKKRIVFIRDCPFVNVCESEVDCLDCYWSQEVKEKNELIESLYNIVEGVELGHKCSGDVKKEILSKFNSELGIKE